MRNDSDRPAIPHDDPDADTATGRMPRPAPAADRGPDREKSDGRWHGLVRPRVARLVRWMIGWPYVGPMVWWLKMTVKGPRTTVELREQLEAVRGEVDQLRRGLAESAAEAVDQRALIRRLGVEIDELKGRNPVSESVYDAFEAEFRGDCQVIRQRAEVYLPVIKSVSAGTPGFPVIDIGCGRGEWLQLLREHGLSAKGVDSNSTFVERVRALGLDVEEAEGIYYLMRSPDSSAGAVTAFHVVEHLDTNALFALIREAHRVIRPGGTLILETPNPENVVVGSCSFYTDPTHRKPIPPQTLSFYLRNSGFSNVSVASLAPLNLVEGSFADALKPIVDRFNMGQDYAAIGYKL